MSRLSTFEELCRRNALRRESGLPLLDMREESDRALRREAVAEHLRLRQRYNDVYERYRQEVLAELRTEQGPDFGSTLSGQRAAATLADKRFSAHLERLGLARPPPADPPVMYGDTEP